MIGILVESLLLELACLPFGAKKPAVIVGGALATLWALSQKVLVQIVLYGAPILGLYKDLLARAEGWLHLPRTGGMWVVGPFALLIASLGATAALVGLSAARAAARERAEARA